MASFHSLRVMFLVFITLVSGQFDDVFDIPEDSIPEEEACECVPYYLCENGTIITQAGLNLINPKIIGVCNGSVEVCCKVPDLIPSAEHTTPETTFSTPGCGHRNAYGVSFTMANATDREANFGEFPWMVALLKEEVVEGTDHVRSMYKAGGSLIHPQVVLTAAHKVYAFRQDVQAQALKIRAGEWDMMTTKELLSHQDRIVSEVIIHEEYDGQYYFNDVALLILRDPVTPAQHVDFACLPSQGQNFDFSSCYANGWGMDVYGEKGRYQTILKKVELPIVPNQPTCQDALRKARLGPYYLLHESFICAGGNGTVDTCTGDGGSPLVCPMINNPERYQQAGIVAWGLGCGDGTPGVYVNVALFRNWIDQKMASKNFDTSYYTYDN